MSRHQGPILLVQCSLKRRDFEPCRKKDDHPISDEGIFLLHQFIEYINW